VKRSSEILAATFEVLAREKINIQMISQGASKVNITMICDSSEAERVIHLLHDRYFGVGGEGGLS
jgi:aspartate kinase